MRLGWVWGVAFFAGLAVAWAQGGGRVSFVTRDGEPVENAKVVRVEPDGVSVMRAEGIAKISFEGLPDEMRERFHMTSESVQKYRAKRAADAKAKAAGESADDKGDYEWHPAGGKIVGSFIYARDGKVLVQERTPYNYGCFGVGVRLLFLADLPTLEQERVGRLSGQQSPEAARAGASLMDMHLRQLGQ